MSYSDFMQPKYWCKHCEIYVKDTNFERKQHESTGKHQGNLRRFLQGIQKNHLQNEREKERTKAEVERLNRIAGAPSSTSEPAINKPPSSKSMKATTGSLSAADQKRQWAQLADMGIAVPEHARAEMAMVGDWQTISRKPVVEPEQSADDKLNVGVRKRKFDDDEDNEYIEESAARKGWGAATKRYPGNDDHVDDDLDSLIAQSIAKPHQKAPADSLHFKAEPVDADVKPEPEVTEDSAPPDNSSKTIAETSSDMLALESKVKTETDESNLGTAGESKPVFKKRKPKPQSAT